MVSANSSTTNRTLSQYRQVLSGCRDLFLKKTMDYGTSWRVLRPISLADQVYIKAWRIRMIQENKVQLIGDSVASEFVGIVNYGIIALIQESITDPEALDLEPELALSHYDAEVQRIEELMLAKNHDYGEAWRNLSQESFADLILVKLLRIRQILSNNGETLVSEGCDANFMDIVNYAIFALIKLDESNSRP